MNQPAAPFLTIITPVYNRASLLGACYESLCRQTELDFEWIVVDDGSTDGSAELAEAFAADRFPTAGVFLYAMMAAGGDLGASVAPQLVGIITDAVIANDKLSAMAGSMGLAPDQLGMKLGLLVGMLFPLVGIFVFIRLRKERVKKGLEQ